eukprot:s1362_g6.t1
MSSLNIFAQPKQLEISPTSLFQLFSVIVIASRCSAMKLAWLRQRRASNAKAFDTIGPSPPSTPSASPCAAAAGRPLTPSRRCFMGEAEDVNLLEDLPLNLKSQQKQLPSLTDSGADRMARSAPVKRNGGGSITLSASLKPVASSPVNGENSNTLSDFQRKGDQRRLSLPCPMPKSLSYSGDDFSEIVEAIESEAPTFDWFRDLWVHLLAGKRSGMVKLPVKSLGGWVQVYNSWQALGNWTPGCAPVLLDAAQLQAVTASPKLKVMEWMKVFGGTKSGAVKLNMPMFLCTCITLANTISKKQKLRFLLGIFDENDSSTFNQEKFQSFISAFFQGLQLNFGLQLKNRGHSEICLLSKKLLARSGADDAAVSQLEQWLLGETGDPLAIPFALLLERHSGRGDDPELFLPEEKKFRLSHRSLVDPPMELALALDASFLQRSEMQVIREIFRHCESRHCFDISHLEAERVTKLEINPNLWCNKLARALEQVEIHRQNGRKISMEMFLRQLCPRADAHHLLMFQSWMREVEKKEELQKRIERCREVMHTFEEYQSLPLLDQAEKLNLLKDYEFLEFELRTSRSIESLVPASSRLLTFEQEMIEGKLSQDEILTLMCPPGFRQASNSSNGRLDLVVEAFLKMEAAHAQQHLAQTEFLFAPTTNSIKRSFYKPRVSAHVLALWHSFLEILDPEKSGWVTYKQMLCSGMCPEAAGFMCHELGEQEAFSAEEFLAEMMKIHHVRP